MLDYIRNVKIGLRDVYGFKPFRSPGGEPCFNNIPDGVYPMAIDGEIDHVLVHGGYFQVARFGRVSNGVNVKNEDFSLEPDETILAPRPGVKKSVLYEWAAPNAVVWVDTDKVGNLSEKALLVLESMTSATENHKLPGKRLSATVRQYKRLSGLPSAFGEDFRLVELCLLGENGREVDIVPIMGTRLVSQARSAKEVGDRFMSEFADRLNKPLVKTAEIYPFEEV